ncbi:hypothetical protein SGLAM104S_09487 [Streptomyces glaucescens]
MFGMEVGAISGTETGVPRRAAHRFRGRETPLHRRTRIAHDAFMSTTGETARRAATAATGVAP